MSWTYLPACIYMYVGRRHVLYNTYRTPPIHTGLVLPYYAYLPFYLRVVQYIIQSYVVAIHLAPICCAYFSKLS